MSEEPKRRLLRRSVEDLTLAAARVKQARAGLDVAWAQLGIVLRGFREAAKMTLRDAAKKVGVSAPFLSGFERGRRSMSDTHLKSYVALFELQWKDEKSKAQTAPTVFIDVGGPTLKIMVGGRIHFFEDHPQLGPMSTTHDGRGIKDTKQFLHAVTCWAQQGREIKDGLCVWTKPS